MSVLAPAELYRLLVAEGEPLKKYLAFDLVIYFGKNAALLAAIGFVLGAAVGLALWPVVQLARGWRHIADPLLSVPPTFAESGTAEPKLPPTDRETTDKL